MDKTLKEKILYSDLITELITTKKAIAIYLGGSRLEGLDHPESDYDIVVLGLTDDIYCYKDRRLYIDDLKIQIQASNIMGYIELLNKPVETKHPWNIQYVLDFLLLTEDNLLYKSKTYIELSKVFKEHSRDLTLFAFDKIFQMLNKKIEPPFCYYSKAIYAFYKYSFMVEEYLKNNTIVLPEEKRKELLNIKINKVIPKSIFTYYDNKPPINYYSIGVEYQKLYEEVKTYVQKSLH